jgi:3-keto-disaccharide hydrolase
LTRLDLLDAWEARLRRWRVKTFCAPYRATCEASTNLQERDNAMADPSQTGYDDTPLIPGQPWRVHDSARPWPPTVSPGVEPRLPPSDAVVLFDGADLSSWLSFASGQAAPWKVGDGSMEVVPGTGDIRSRQEFGDCQLHVEFATPAEVVGSGQARGNSGVFLMGRYEIQVLDCFANRTYADGATAAIYGQYPPLVNACRPPGVWQSYDVVWIAPRFDGGRLVSPPFCTVTHNGVVVQYHRELLGPTTHRKAPEWVPHGPVGPLRLQDHNDPVRFRNIWYRPLNIGNA